MRPRSRRVAVLLAAVAAVLLAGCGGGTGNGRSAGTPAAGDEDALPPHELDALAPVIDPWLAPLGFRLTRGALVDRDAPGEATPDGDHLALYAEPLAHERPAGAYLDDLAGTAAAVFPRAFGRWPDLASLDLCLEPPDAVDPSDAPPAYTLVDLTRAQSAAVDWPTVDLVALLALDRAGAGVVRVLHEPAELPRYREASAAATGRDPPG